MQSTLPGLTGRADEKYLFSALDIVLCLALALRIHKTDVAIKRTAMSMLSRVPPQDRGPLLKLLRSNKPAAVVEHILGFLGED
ncbi:hypothetical protein D3C81_365290 [compost metagenome]